MKKPISIYVLRPNETHWTFAEYGIRYDPTTSQVVFRYLENPSTEYEVDLTKALPTLNRLRAIAPNMEITVKSDSDGLVEVNQRSSVPAPPDVIASAFEIHKLEESRPKMSTKSLQQMSVEEFKQYKEDATEASQYQRVLMRKEVAFITRLNEVVSNECQRIYDDFKKVQNENI